MGHPSPEERKDRAGPPDSGTRADGAVARHIPLFPDAPTGGELSEFVPLGDPSAAPLARFAREKENEEAALKLVSVLRLVAEIGLPRGMDFEPVVRRHGDGSVGIRVPGTDVEANCRYRPERNRLVVLAVLRGEEKIRAFTTRPDAEGSERLRRRIEQVLAVSALERKEHGAR